MRVDRLVFKVGAASDAPALELEPKRVTLFIGPNNGGKSRALQEIQFEFAHNGHQENLIFCSIRTSLIEEEELAGKLNKISRVKRPGENPDPDVIAIGGRMGDQLLNLPTLRQALLNISHGINRQLASDFTRLFCLNLNGANRLGLVSPVQAQPIGANPLSTIGAVFKDDGVRATLSTVVKQAFDKYLVIDPTQMPNLSYMLSDNPAENGIEKSLSDAAVDFFSRCKPLSTASDGTKAFIGILSEVLAGDPDVILIDEPEAFLHPSLAFLLGQKVAESAREGKQLYAATHSSAFLLGCVLSGTDVEVVRLTHTGSVSTARHLSADRLKALMSDPLFRSVGAVNALFYECAVVVEGDSDRAFYDEVNTRLQRFSTGGLRHSAVLNAHNKQTVVNIVSPLREIGIPAAFIFDIDWVKEDGQVWDKYFKASGAPLGMKDALGMARRNVRNALEAVDLDYKRKGGIHLLSGDDRATADAFFDQMEEYGLFTVRHGELESWLPSLSVERTKSKFLASIFAAMGSDPSAVGYIKPADDDVWDFLRKIAGWVSDANRRGMG